MTLRVLIEPGAYIVAIDLIMNKRLFTSSRPFTCWRNTTTIAHSLDGEHLVKVWRVLALPL